MIINVKFVSVPTKDQDRALEFSEAAYPPHRWAFEQGYPLT